MLYFYTAKNNQGEIIEGKRESPDKFSLSHELREEQSTLITAHEISVGIDFSAINHLFVRITLHEKVIFTRNLSAMLSAGIALARSLGILERQTTNFKFKKVLNSLLDDINKGLSLSAGMKKFPKVFSPLFSSMTEAGEESGGLPDALHVIGMQLDKSYTMGKKIRGALMYPAVVLSAIFVIGVLMFIYVVPTLTVTFKDLHAELPQSTKIIIAISNFLVGHTALFIFSVVLVVVAFIVGFRTKRGGRFATYIILHFPIFGPIVKEVNAARTARTLSSLLSAGVDVRSALNITGSVIQNVYYKEILDEAGINVEKGLALSSIFKEKDNLYPTMVGEMMEVGEETGKLSEMLKNIADFYEDEVDTTTKDLSALLEPILMIIIGAAVGFFAVAMITPTYSILNSI